MTAANVFRRGMILLALIGLPCFALAGVSEQGTDHDKMHEHGATMATGGHWMAPEDAAKRSNPVAADRASRQRGWKLFTANCASCHGASARGDGPAGAALNPRPADLTVMAGQHPDGDFAWKIANGRGPMPAWNGQLSEKNIWDLVNFIQGLAGTKKNHQHDHRH
jgi:mono/diheme cytochrome c family protein